MSAYQLAKNACFLTFEPCFLAGHAKIYGVSECCTQALAGENDLAPLVCLRCMQWGRGQARGKCGGRTLSLSLAMLFRARLTGLGRVVLCAVFRLARKAPGSAPPRASLS